jgi:hypothetical protein
MHLVCYFGSISIGILISGVFGFLLALTIDNGFAFNPDANAYFMIANVVGEGLFIAPMGYTMGLFGYKALIIEVAAFSVLTVVAFVLSSKSMEDDKN